MGSAQNEKNGIKKASAPHNIGDINWLPYSIAVNIDKVYRNIPKKYATALKIIPIIDPPF
jgi:hypothetical protein